MVRAVVDHGLSKAEAARRYNTTPKTVTKWVDRFHNEGVDGLRDRSGSRIAMAQAPVLATDSALSRPASEIVLIMRNRRSLDEKPE
jgi:transposase